MVGRSVADVFPGAEEQGFIALLDTVLRTGEPYAAKGALYRMAPPEGGAEVELYLDFFYQPIADLEGVVTGICVQGNDVTDLTHAMNRLARIARIDDLTGLSNRAAMLEAIERAITGQNREGTGFSLLYVDLDGFKHLNDAHGHAAGDQALVEVAGALNAITRGTDSAGRVGGDEFAVVVIGGLVAAEAIAERVRAKIAARMAARRWTVSASIGIAAFSVPPPSAEAALAQADAAMYVVKRKSKVA